METRSDLFEYMQTIKGDRSSKILNVQNNLNKLFSCEHYFDDNLDSIIQAIYRFSNEIFKQWKKSNRTKAIFIKIMLNG